MQMPGGRLLGRLFCFAFVAAGMVHGQGFPKTTQVQDVVYRADGTPATGWLVLSWPAFVTADGAAVAAGTKSVQLGRDGSLSVALAPNAGGQPTGTYYAATLKLDGGLTSKEAWVVPAESPAKLSGVRAAVVPSTMAIQALTADWASANLVNLAGAQTISGAKNFQVSPSTPAPVNANDVANKQYVDQSGGAAGPNVAKTNLKNTWTQPQVFPSAVMQDVKQFPMTAYGALSGQDATSVMDNILSLVPASGSGTMQVPPGIFTRTKTLDTTASGFLTITGAKDGWGQFQSVLNIAPTGATDCIRDTYHAYPYTHSLYLAGFWLQCGPGAGDAIHLVNSGNLLGAIDNVTVTSPAGTAYGGSGALFHLQNVFTFHADRLYGLGGTYGLNLDGDNEVQVSNSQFSDASIANVHINGNVNRVNADLSILKNGGTAAIVIDGQSSGNVVTGYHEPGTGNYSELTLASLGPMTFNNDLSSVWSSDITNSCVDLGYGNKCPKGQGYWGEYAAAYTNMWPNSSFTGPTSGTGIVPINLNCAVDNTTGVSYASSYKCTFSGTTGQNAFLELPCNSGVATCPQITANHTYVLRAQIKTDQPYKRGNSTVTNAPYVGVEMGTVNGGNYFPSHITSGYTDNVWRQHCLVVGTDTTTKETGFYFALFNGQNNSNTMWITDVTLADITDIHGVNPCSNNLPYIPTFGASTATYSPGAASVIQNRAAIGAGNLFVADDAANGNGILRVGTSAGYNGTGQIGDSGNPVGAINTNTATVNTLLSAPGNSVAVGSDFTTANSAAFQAIAGLTFNLPATAYKWKYRCAMAYSQANGTAAVSFGMQAAAAPTNVFGVGEQQITAGPPSTSTRGVLATLSNTAATTIVSGTPGATGTNYVVTLEGTFENPAATNAMNFVVQTANGSDAVTVKRGSECQIW